MAFQDGGGVKVNRYLYNGNEIQTDLNFNLYDFKARYYDPVTGRFLSVDPLSADEKQVLFSPYQFGWNNPIRFNDPTGECLECEVERPNPFKGEVYRTTGGADYVYGKGAWTRQGGTLNEVTVTAQKPSLLEKGFYRGQAAAQDVWNSPLTRAYVPDKISLSFSSSVTAFVGTNTEFSLNWITRGHDAQFTPYAVLTLGGQVGPKGSGDALIKISTGYYATTDMRSLPTGKASRDLLGWSVYGSADAGVGLGGTVTGSIGFERAPFMSSPTWISGGVGVGASIGVGASGGVSYSWPIVPKQFKR